MRHYTSGNANRGRALLAPVKPMSQCKAIPGQKVSQDTYSAFIPAPLPPVFEWTPRLIRSLSDADRLIGRLAGEGGRLPNPHVLIRPFIRSEAVLSSRIEGTKPHWASCWLPKPGLSLIAAPKICAKSETTSLPWSMESPSFTNYLSASGSSVSCTASSWRT